MFKKGC